MNEYKKILVITYWGLGDFVWATSALALLKKSLPKTEITLLMLKVFAKLAKNNPVIDRYFFYYHNRNDSFFIDRVKKALWFLRYFFQIAFAHYDACIFLDNSVLLTLIVKLAGIKVIAGPATRASGYNILEPSAKLYTHLAQLNPDSAKLHMSERYQTIIRSFLGTQNIAMPILPDTKHLRDKALSLIEPKKGFAICIAYKGQVSNTLSNERVIELIKAFNLKTTASFYLLGDKKMIDNSDIIIKYLEGIRVKNLCGKTDLLTLKAVLENIDLLISSDTGIMHIAAEAGTKIVSLHGHTLPENSRPVSAKANSLCSYLECSPCSCPVCPNDLKCLSSIKNDEIILSGLKLLQEL